MICYQRYLRVIIRKDMGKPPERDYANRTKNYSNRTFCIRPDYSNRTFYACNLLIIIGNPWIVFTFFKEWAFLGLKASSFTHRASSPRLSEKSRRELKSLYPYTRATTIFQSSQGVLLLLRQSPPRMLSIGERPSPPENFGKVQNSGEIPDIIKRRKGLLYQSFWLFL